MIKQGVSSKKQLTLTISTCIDKSPRN